MKAEETRLLTPLRNETASQDLSGACQSARHLDILGPCLDFAVFLGDLRGPFLVS